MNFQLDERLAAARDTCEPMLHIALAHDPQVEVRLTLASNAALTDIARGILARDDDPQVRRRAARLDP